MSSLTFYRAEIERLKLALEKGQEPEIVICSAVRLPDGRLIRGHRHGDCLKTAHELVIYQKLHGYSDLEWSNLHGDDQGFITSKNRYVDRQEGMRLQKAAGIESKSSDGKGYRGDTLFSEDLY